MTPAESRRSVALNRVYALMESGGVAGGYNLSAIQQIAAEDRQSFPTDFIKLFMIPSYYTPFLRRLILNEGQIDTYDYDGDLNCFVKVFTWFVREFGCSTVPGYLGSGKAKEEAHIDTDDAVANVKWVEAYYASQGKFPHICLARLDLVSAKAMIDSFGDIRQVRRGMEQYIFDSCFEDDEYPDSHRWEKFKMMLERCRLPDDDHDNGIIGGRNTPASRQRFVTAGDVIDGSDDESSVRLVIGHSLLWLLLNPARFSIPYDTSKTKRCLRWIKEHQPNVFLERNTEGSTILDIVVRESVRPSVRVSATNDQPQIQQQQQQWEDLAFFVIGENPEACLIRDFDGGLALDVCFRTGSPELFRVIASASASLLSSFPSLHSCRGTGLYPFQLAATPPVADDESVAADEESLSRIYLLLRQAPSLVTDGVPPPSCAAGSDCSIARSFKVHVETSSRQDDQSNLPPVVLVDKKRKRPTSTSAP